MTGKTLFNLRNLEQIFCELKGENILLIRIEMAKHIEYVVISLLYVIIIKKYLPDSAFFRIKTWLFVTIKH